MGGCDAIILSEILWYLLNDLDAIIVRLKNSFHGGYVLINQSFYDPRDQKYGKEYFTTPQEVVDYFGMECFSMVTARSPQAGDYSAHMALKIV